MMVIFVSRCQKKAIRSTRRVLDAFADRIGDSTWQTVITEDGLAMVKKLLRQSVTKNTAVTCRWIRSRSRSELVWIVGSRNKFNKEGIVPVNTTQRNIQHDEWENNWERLPQIKALTAIASLFHDWGKCSVLFQEKLKPKNKTIKNKVADPLRHEWVSCALLHALVVHSGNQTKDDAWLGLLHNWTFDESELVNIVQSNRVGFLEKLPPIAQVVAWMILSHHKLPFLYDEADRTGYHKIEKNKFGSIFESINEKWGYKNSENADKCFEFKFGLLKNSSILEDQVKMWAGRLIDEKEKLLMLFNNESLRLVLNYARLSLILSDHYISSSEAENKRNDNQKLFANTDNKGELKQKLDEHLVKVSKQTVKIVRNLAYFCDQMEKVYDVKTLKQKSPAEFAWQDNVAEKIKRFRNESTNQGEAGWFVVNMASTGCGKTIANAKIMKAVSEDGDGLRYILALGLRTLTLQTGDEYRDKIGLNNEELAVLIGSTVVKELHNQKVSDLNNYSVENEDELLLKEELDFSGCSEAGFLDVFFQNEDKKMTEKNKAFLYKPILACTIDHIIAATEMVRGRKHILPFLRLMSSDLVIDEIDDFEKQDLIAIGRLVHLAGMLGRNVTLSSATIPPSLAEGLFNAYREGWKCHCDFYKKTEEEKPKPIIGAWCDEFSSKVENVNCCDDYAKRHEGFVKKRIDELQKQVVKRKGYIVRCGHLRELQGGFNDIKKGESRRQRYFELIKDTAKKLHSVHYSIDKKTGKKVSFGVVRLANTIPCVELGEYLIEADWGDDFAPKVIIYHSRQVLLLRHELGRHLDAVLKRKEKEGEEPLVFSDPIIRKHLDEAAEGNVLFVLVATPIEEIGRDHDFDWAVVEPSSFRSLIQLAGRVLRHRLVVNDIVTPNIAIMQYNLKGLEEKEKTDDDGKCVFNRPGYEKNKSYSFETHDMVHLVDENGLMQGVNAIPRIKKRSDIKPKEKLVDLEHFIMNEFKDTSNSGPETLAGWLTGFWWLTALPQQLNRFRESSPEIQLYLVWEKGKFVFKEKEDNGIFVSCSVEYGIKFLDNETNENRWWLPQDYQNYGQALKRQVSRDVDMETLTPEEKEEKLTAMSKRFGEVRIRSGEEGLVYSDQFGLVGKKYCCF